MQAGESKHTLQGSLLSEKLKGFKLAADLYCIFYDLLTEIVALK